MWIRDRLEGLIRLAIFIGYIALISLTPDIKRVFMYHGAEHKCINCIEHGMELNVENAVSYTHLQCGGSESSAKHYYRGMGRNRLHQSADGFHFRPPIPLFL